MIIVGLNTFEYHNKSVRHIGPLGLTASAYPTTAEKLKLINPIHKKNQYQNVEYSYYAVEGDELQAPPWWAVRARYSRAHNQAIQRPHRSRRGQVGGQGGRSAPSRRVYYVFPLHWVVACRGGKGCRVVYLGATLKSLKRPLRVTTSGPRKSAARCSSCLISPSGIPPTDFSKSRRCFGDRFLCSRK
ncbi:hypothetical protein BDW74DRAFT_91278 [Aspergillus multicolor]|uniref:uncharacterized protein n=1 Tax=Aspergillus multicolor TaxID=41759 RepID=UPI003CCD5282